MKEQTKNHEPIHGGIRVKCSICTREIEPLVLEGKVYWNQGNNAEPINDGRCCDLCNSNVVIPLRIKNMTEKRK